MGDVARALGEHDVHRARKVSDGGEDPCLLSVCLIVKNEEQLLGECLASVSGLADEVVVYDTGSTDRTIEIARASGARVVEGYWDDSFARARNAALSYARGEWVLSLDADETLLSVASNFRATLLTQSAEVDAYLVPIENLHGAGNARSVHTAVRLFRRARATWRHRLHEQVVANDDWSQGLRIGYFSGGRIIHSGYVPEIFESRDKAERNLDLARAALLDEDGSRAYALMNYGRALESAGRSDEAVEALLEASSLTDDPITHRLAVKNLIYILQRRGRFDEALGQVAELRGLSSNQIVADIAEGNIRIAMGDAHAGLSLLARVPPRGRDDDGMEYSAHTLAALRGEALASLERYGEAADVVLETIRVAGIVEVDLGELASWLSKSGRSSSEIARTMQEADLMPMLGRLVSQPSAVADEILEGIWTNFRGRLEPLAAAARLAPRLEIARALVWSSRLRAQGLDTSCPLVAIARDSSVDAVVRLLACAAAFSAFDERRVIRAALEARDALAPEQRREALAMLERMAPNLFEQVVDEASSQINAPLATPLHAPAKDRGRTTPTLPAMVVAPRPQRGGINVVAPFESSDRYGHVARGVTTALGLGHVKVSSTSYHASGWPTTVAWNHVGTGDLPYDATLFVMSPDELTNLAIDLGATPFENRYAIGVWLWDFEIPSELMATAARMLHEIWVPSQLVARVVRTVTDRPVSVMAVPAQPNAAPATASEDGTFNFVASIDYRAGFERQNVLATVDAFCSAFEESTTTRLYVEVAHESEYPSEHSQLLQYAKYRDDIIVTYPRDGVSGHELLGRSPQNTCFVSLHRSEGTGLALIQAATMGIPLIATDCSFVKEIMGTGYEGAVPASRRPIPTEGHWCAPGGYWWEPDVAAAAAMLREMWRTRTQTSGPQRPPSSRALPGYSATSCARAISRRVREVDRLRYGRGITGK